MTEDPWRRPDEGAHISAEKARGGEIVLRTPLRRAIFIGGLVLIVIVVAVGPWLR